MNFNLYLNRRREEGREDLGEGGVGVGERRLGEGGVGSGGIVPRPTSLTLVSHSGRHLHHLEGGE
jgi:hypothetical protein